MHLNEIMNQVTTAIKAGDTNLARQLIVDNDMLKNDSALGACVAEAMVHGQCVFARELLMSNPHALSAVRIKRDDPNMKAVPNALELVNDIERAKQCDQTYLIMRQARQRDTQPIVKQVCSVQ